MHDDMSNWLIQLTPLLGGFLMGIWLERRSRLMLQRGRYLLLMSIGSILGNLILLLAFAAMYDGHMTQDAYFFTMIGIIGIQGYYYGILSAGRSLDAFGTKRQALFFFIPLANIHLMIGRPSQNPELNAYVDSRGNIRHKVGISNGWLAGVFATLIYIISMMIWPLVEKFLGI